MTRWIVGVVTALNAVAAPGAVLAQSPDDVAVREVVQLYFNGITHNDSVALRRAFAPEARLMFVRRDGSLYVVPFEDWIAFAKQPPAAQGKTNRIVTVDIGGNAAVAKTDLQWPGVHYVDYLSLLKVQGEWRIVHKIWWQEPRTS